MCVVCVVLCAVMCVRACVPARMSMRYIACVRAVCVQHVYTYQNQNNTQMVLQNLLAAARHSVPEQHQHAFLEDLCVEEMLLDFNTFLAEKV